MAYSPKTWVNGEVITADDLNHLEQGVANEQVGPPGPAGADGKDGKDGADGKDGQNGAPGPAGADGKDGKDGEGVPAGGTAGQVLAKRTAADYDTYWVDPPQGGGGGVAGVSTFNGRSGAVIPQKGDYTADMVGAATMQQVNEAIQWSILDSWEESY